MLPPGLRLILCLLFLRQQVTGQLFVLRGQLPQAADIFGLEHLLGHGRVDEVAQRGGACLLQREVEVLPEVVEEAADLRVVDDADHRHALPGGKDQRVQPHGDDERHPADECHDLRAVAPGLQQQIRAAQLCGDGVQRGAVTARLHGIEHRRQAVLPVGVFRRVRKGGDVTVEVLPRAQGEQGVARAVCQTAAVQEAVG